MPVIILFQQKTLGYFTERVPDNEVRKDMIENNRKQAESVLKKFDKKPNVGTDPDAYEATMKKWEADKKAAQEKVDYWNKVAEANEMQEADLTEDVKTEDVNQSENNLEMVAEGQSAPGQSGVVDNNSANTLQNGNNELNLQEENESDNESNQNDIPVGGQVPQSVPQGEHGTQDSQVSGMEETASRLRERIEADGGTPQGGLSRNARDVENRVTREYAQENGLWIPFEDVFKLGRPSKSGNEHDTYLNAEQGVIYKVNNRMNTPSILDLLDRMEQHNEFFPDSKYSLVGFTAVSENGDVWPVFAQEYVPNARMATNEEIDSYMGALGFTRVGDGRYSNGEVVIKDLKPRNVLADADGDIYVVDAEFEQENTQKSGETAENESGKMYSPEELAQAKEQLGELNATSAPEFAARLFSIKPWKTLEEANAALKELLASYGETLNGQSLAVMPFLDKAQGLIKEYNKSQEPRSTEDEVAAFDKQAEIAKEREQRAGVAPRPGHLAAAIGEGNEKAVKEWKANFDAYLQKLNADDLPTIDVTIKGMQGRKKDIRKMKKDGYKDDSIYKAYDYIEMVLKKRKKELENEQRTQQSTVTSQGIVNTETLQPTMSESDFAELVKGDDIEAMRVYLKEVEDALLVNDASPFAGEMALREEYRRAVEQYGKENIPAEVMQSLNERMKPYAELSRELFDRKYALQDRVRELESAADKTDLAASTAEKALNKKYNFDGKVMTVAEFVEDAVGRGDVKLSAIEEPKYKGASRAAWNRMDARQQEADAKRVKESGTKTVYTVNDHDLGKTAYDYAKFLQEKKAVEQKPKEKIEDVGEVLAGARKDELKVIASSFENATAKSLIELPFSKAFKKPDLKKAVESGALREEDALFYEAMFNALINSSKPKNSARHRNAVETWAEETYNSLQLIKSFVEADEVARDRAMAEALEDKFPARAEELAVIEKRKVWNARNNAEWGDKTTPNPVWVTHEVLKALGYKPGDKVEIPFGVLKANVFATGYEFYNKKGERLIMQSVPTVEEGIENIVWLSKIKRGDADTMHPVSSFFATPTKRDMGDSGRYYVLWGTVRNPRRSEFGSIEEANAFAAGHKEAVVRPIQEVVKRYGYKIVFRNPLTGDKFFVNDMEFETEGEAMQYLEDNYDAVNEQTNALLAKERGEAKKEVSADDLLEVAMVRGKEGWKYAVNIKGKYANNMGMPLLLREFDTREDAKAFLNESKNEVFEIYKKQQAEQKKFVFFDTGENSRIGEDYRGGRDVTAQDFMDTFGFRGVQFGNWTNQDDRQMAVNQAFDAFLDLAKLLGVSPKALSLNGELGMAFGSRGSGFGNAHYELGEIVINLTKTRGAGSLAHEWWHALDNYFARRANVPMGMVTDSRSIDMRPELRQAYNDLLKMIEESDFYKRSKARGDYWGRMHEVTARLMAEWVDQSLKDKGELNTFLSRGVNEERYKRMNYDTHRAVSLIKGKEAMSYEEFEKTPEALAGFPYPSREELKEFGDAMRNIFETVEEQETEEGKVALYNKARKSSPVLEGVKKMLSLAKTNTPSNEKAIQEVSGRGQQSINKAYFRGIPEYIYDALERAGRRPTAGVKVRFDEYNMRKPPLAETEKEELYLQIVRMATNREIENEILPILEEVAQKAKSETARVDAQDFIRLIERFKRRNERGYIIRDLSGAELDTEIPLSKIDELFSRYNSDDEVAEIYERVRAIAEDVGLTFSFSEKEFSSDNVFGEYRLYDNSVIFNDHMLYSSYMTQQEKATTIVHEIIHAVTQYAIDAYKNGDKLITNYNSRGEVATVATERDGKIVSVDSYDEGALFEHTEYDRGGKAASVTRYDKQGNEIGTQVYVDGKAVPSETTEQPETGEVANAGPVNIETLQLNMSEEDFNALLSSGDKAAISEYLAEMDGLLRIGVGSPLDGRDAIVKEYRGLVEQYGGEGNIPADVVAGIDERIAPYNALQRAVFDRKYALQDYIIRKLDDRGQKNDFLSNHVAPEEWDGDAKGYPFPLGEDAKRIADAFDNLFATLEEKTTEDGKVVLYRSAKEKRKNNSSSFNDNEDWLSLPFANNKDYGRRESNTGSQKRGGNDSGYNPMARFLGRVVEEILSESEKRGYGEPSNEIRWAIIENEKQNGKVYTSSLIQEEIVEVLRRLSNNEIDAVLSLFQETLNEEWIKDEMYSEDREEVETVIRLINRFKAKNERKYIIEKLSGVNLGEGVAQSRIDELFDLYNSDKELAELYDRIKERAKEVGLSYSFSDNMEDSTYGKYSPYDNHIELNAHLLYSSILPQQDKAASIAHEIIHAVTQYAIRIKENRNKGIAPRVNISQELLDAAQILIDVYEKAVRDNPELKHAKYNSERREYSDYIFYGTESVHEMVSELSNPEFRDKLKKVKYDDRSIWRVIWDAIKSIFVDVKYKKRSAYKDISKAFDTLVENFDKNAYADAWDISQPLAKKDDLLAGSDNSSNTQEGETLFSKKKLTPEQKKSRRL